MKYFLFRILKIIPIVICVTIITFSLMQIGKADPAVMHYHHLGFEPSEEMLTTFRKEHGLDQSLPKQYAIWWGKILRLDFGESFADGRAVSEKIADAFPYTLSLAVNSIALTLAISLPLGVFLAMYERSVLGKIFG